MRIYIGFLLFFVTINNGMSLLKKIYSADEASLKQLKVRWSLHKDNRRTFALCKFGIRLSKINITLLSFNKKLIGEIRIDKIKGEPEAITYLLSQLITLARKKNFETIGYHAFYDYVHQPVHSALCINGFTKTLIRSNLGNKISSNKPIEHYFYEKIL